MTLSEVVGDLFDAGLPAIGHGCNTKGAMGAGIAVEFRRRYPEMYREYRRRCASGGFRLGEIFVWEAPDRIVYNLATQPRPGPSATVDAIRESVTRALVDAEVRGLAQLGVPRLGAGLGGLDWEAVRTALLEASTSSPVELVVVMRGTAGSGSEGPTRPSPGAGGTTQG
jgi:O-acetyl-ADP-ribose deacetylase (regulator of RNase III)